MNLAAHTAWKIAVVGAGPAGLALALQAARALPRAEVTLFDARPLDKDVSLDPRTLALAQGSVLWLERLGAWPADKAQPILEVRVSQAPPTLALAALPGLQAEVQLRAAELGVPQLGAVLSYGALVSRLQQAWEAVVAQAEVGAETGAPGRLRSRFGTPVAAIKPVAGGVEVDAGFADTFDLAVVAEGGVFAEQARKAVRRDYGQVAWVGTATLADATPGLAVERFTREGPLALLPLRPGADGAARAALVWCVPANDDPVAELDDVQRLVVLNQRLPRGMGRLVALSPLKRFALGLNAERTLVDADGGRTVRIGNAAQTLHPVAGQGLNLGLRDAAALVQLLRRATPASLPQHLRGLDWARGPDRWSMIAATDFLARSFTWGAPGLPAARGLGLAAVQALPGLRQALARQMMFGRR